jgi:hypothetical protein
MALTAEVLKANEALTGLTDDQVAAISTLSTNDEKIVLNTKSGEHHGNVERDVLEVSGVAKNEGEKSFDYMKRVLGDFKTSATGSAALQGEIDGYKTKVANLEDQIEKGSGDQATVQKLRDAEGKLLTLQGAYDTDKGAWETKEGDYKGQITGIRVNSEFGKAIGALKFKTGYPESIQKTLITSAKNEILATLKPDWIGADGSKTMVFRDAEGAIQYNKANSLQPYTAAELISEKLKDVIDTGRKVPGAGTGNPPGEPSKIDLVDVAGAKTQIEADDIISKYLMQQGILRGSSDFATKQNEIRTKNAVDKLPLR